MFHQDANAHPMSVTKISNRYFSCCYVYLLDPKNDPPNNLLAKMFKDVQDHKDRRFYLSLCYMLAVMATLDSWNTEHEHNFNVFNILQTFKM